MTSNITLKAGTNRDPTYMAVSSVLKQRFKKNAKRGRNIQLLFVSGIQGPVLKSTFGFES